MSATATPSSSVEYAGSIPASDYAASMYSRASLTRTNRSSASRRQSRLSLPSSLLPTTISTLHMSAANLNRHARGMNSQLRPGANNYAAYYGSNSYVPNRVTAGPNVEYRGGQPFPTDVHSQIYFANQRESTFQSEGFAAGESVTSHSVVREKISTRCKESSGKLMMQRRRVTSSVELQTTSSSNKPPG